MRIALVSFEYPPDTAVGGIATYMKQWALLLKGRGHDLEVFCASPDRTGNYNEEGILVHRIKTNDRVNFNKLILPVFSERYLLNKIDVVESAEYNCDAKAIQKKFPQIIFVVKLHTPSFLMDRINQSRKKITILKKARFLIGGYMRLKNPKPYWSNYSKIDSNEKAYVMAASIITSPSLSLIDIVKKEWKINKNIYHLPNPFIPSAELLDLEQKGGRKNILFLGRLEKRKGILLFLKIIPRVIKQEPDARFIFVGRDTTILPDNISAKALLKQNLAAYHKNIVFLDHINYSNLPQIFDQANVCVFPSIWENFPTVCLEAMAAGRAIVGSKEGGMTDMLLSPKAGMLVDPADDAEVSNALISLLDDEDAQKELGTEARKSVIEKYNSNILGNAFEKILSDLL